MHGIKCCSNLTGLKVNDINYLWTSSYRSEHPTHDAYLMSNRPYWKHPVRSLAKWQSSSPTESGPNMTHIRIPLTLESEQIMVHLPSHRQKCNLFYYLDKTAFFTDVLWRSYFHLFVKRVYFLYEKIWSYKRWFLKKNDLQILFLYWLNRKLVFFRTPLFHKGSIVQNEAQVEQLGKSLVRLINQPQMWSDNNNKKHYLLSE